MNCKSFVTFSIPITLTPVIEVFIDNLCASGLTKEQVAWLIYKMLIGKIDENAKESMQPEEVADAILNAKQRSIDIARWTSEDVNWNTWMTILNAILARAPETPESIIADVFKEFRAGIIKDLQSALDHLKRSGIRVKHG
ncbi:MULTISPECIES: hypothetical protein [Stenotrophomonas]|uniref:hypothetical protein n=1 Tax=Stenotrophomonas TaxID=40323 RepID=UPI0021C7C3CC|nr:hypothetical protein [Stenotrophomonas maltophilia]MCU1079903.1 hypothetical protein [Stenotrophomonas maltophilia]